jgi:hypothetical protein
MNHPSRGLACGAAHFEQRARHEAEDAHRALDCHTPLRVASAPMTGRACQRRRYYRSF